MGVFAELKKILEELLDLDDRELTPETLLIQDLGAESIDLLELAVTINSRFKIAVKDDEIFLTRFGLYLTDARKQGRDLVHYLAGRYPFLGEDRIAEIMAHIKEGPQLKIRDLVSYITYQSKGI
ncbi:MAG TPA: phosphopantetheine-binding protein [Syntrophales bacterium]|nr:phosphopantetheine-binding protein [Syntrophales bacterium]